MVGVSLTMTVKKLGVFGRFTVKQSSHFKKSLFAANPYLNQQICQLCAFICRFNLAFHRVSIITKVEAPTCLFYKTLSYKYCNEIKIMRFASFKKNKSNRYIWVCYYNTISAVYWYWGFGLVICPDFEKKIRRFLLTLILIYN